VRRDAQHGGQPGAGPARASPTWASNPSNGRLRRRYLPVSPSTCSVNVTLPQAEFRRKNHRTASRITTGRPPAGPSAIPAMHLRGPHAARRARHPRRPGPGLHHHASPGGLDLLPAQPGQIREKQLAQLKDR
jgi:hypothetical protein